MSTFSTYLVVVQYRVHFFCKVKDVVQIKYNEPTHMIDKCAFVICWDRPKEEPKFLIVNICINSVSVSFAFWVSRNQYFGIFSTQKDFEKTIWFSRKIIQPFAHTAICTDQQRFFKYDLSEFELKCLGDKKDQWIFGNRLYIFVLSLSVELKIFFLGDSIVKEPIIDCS